MSSFLIGLLIAGVVIYVLYLLLNMIILPAPLKSVVYVIVGLIVFLWLLDYFGIYHTGIMTLPSR